tara:strand:- start:123 stop:236 length:114 start_codon:yes stop_codon:yes gene_type:complete
MLLIDIKEKILKEAQTFLGQLFQMGNILIDQILRVNK